MFSPGLLGHCMNMVQTYMQNPHSHTLNKNNTNLKTFLVCNPIILTWVANRDLSSHIFIYIFISAFAKILQFPWFQRVILFVFHWFWEELYPKMLIILVSKHSFGASSWTTCVPSHLGTLSLSSPKLFSGPSTHEHTYSYTHTHSLTHTCWH